MPRRSIDPTHERDFPLVTAQRRGRESAGLLLYRLEDGNLKILLAHPGGPFWRNRDAGAWTIPKGEIHAGEDSLDAARREFREETGIEPSGPFLPLGSIRQKAGKIVHAWACKGDADPASLTSNMARTEWPRGSGRWVTYPEVDRCAWLDPEAAREKINQAQGELIGRLEELLARMNTATATATDEQGHG